MGHYIFAPFLQADIDRFQKICNDYLQETLDTDDIPSIPMLCSKLGISLASFERLKKTNEYREIINLAITRIEARLLNMGLRRKIDTQLLNVYFKQRHGYVDKQQVNIEHNVNVATASIEELEAKIKENEMLEMKYKAKLIE